MFIYISVTKTVTTFIFFVTVINTKFNEKNIFFQFLKFNIDLINLLCYSLE